MAEWMSNEKYWQNMEWLPQNILPKANDEIDKLNRKDEATIFRTRHIPKLFEKYKDIWKITPLMITIYIFKSLYFLMFI